LNVALHYLDTSAVVSALVREPEQSGRVRAWLRDQEPGTLAVSQWVVTEVASALSLKVRTGALTLADRADALAAWQDARESSFTTLPVEANSFGRAAEIAGRHELGVRAGDALHLAVAREAGAALVTLDERMARAAPELGVAVAAI
jgi:uncharacterized protein